LVKPIERPAAVTRAFVRDMRAFLAIFDPIKRDEIAAREAASNADRGHRFAAR